MSEWKAVVCTVLLLIVITIILTASHFINGIYGINLYQLLITAVAYIRIGEGIDRFYSWLVGKEN